MSLEHTQFIETFPIGIEDVLPVAIEQVSYLHLKPVDLIKQLDGSPVVFLASVF